MTFQSTPSYYCDIVRVHISSSLMYLKREWYFQCRVIWQSQRDHCGSSVGILSVCIWLKWPADSLNSTAFVSRVGRRSIGIVSIVDNAIEGVEFWANCKISLILVLLILNLVVIVIGEGASAEDVEVVVGAGGGGVSDFAFRALHFFIIEAAAGPLAIIRISTRSVVSARPHWDSIILK